MKLIKIDDKYINIDKIVYIYSINKYYSREQKGDMMAGNLDQTPSAKTIIQFDGYHVLTNLSVSEVVKLLDKNY